jgi:SAM-dependent methyltransferase
MHRDIAHDGDNVIDWGKTSADYSTWRPNYPDRFFDLLKTFGVGLPGQRTLDLGTGVGFLALRFSQAGALSTGIDNAQEQIQAARHRAESLGVAAQFHVAAAEETGLPTASFDVVTASQSWLYFDKERVIAEVKRLLAPEGLLLTSHFCWLPRQDAVAKASEQLVLQFNPNWTAADLAGDVPFIPKWSEDHFRFHAMFVFDEQIPFTWESWRGRLRACRGVGATLEPKQIEAFDNQHDALLRRITPEHFSVLHRIDAHLFRPIR